MRAEKLEAIDRFEELYEEILADHACIQKKDLAINGKELLALGLPQGKQIGQVLDKLFAKVVEDPACNTKETLLAEARKELEQQG